ncbi:MAG: IS481 family transposase [Terracidiphilus sp.]|nr:IS481 family transposase [Terracidiphilus sp.]
MDYHQNARLTIHSREQLAKMVVEQRLTKKVAASAFRVSEKTAAKWVRRYLQLGQARLRDLSSKPHHSPRRTASTLLERVCALRRLRWNGWRIAREVKLSRATISRILRRAGMNRLCSLDPPPPVQRYEHQRPGELIHFDIKRLAVIRKPGHRVTGQRRGQARGSGWEYLHIAIDDHSRISFAAILPDQSHLSAIRFFLMARAHFNRFGITFRRVYSDNGSCYRHWRYRKTMHQLQLKQRFTRPYTPRTNGKAERFIQTALREWAYARTYQDSREREEQLEYWLHDYNFHRPHASLKLNTPASRAGLNRNNLLSLHS